MASFTESEVRHCSGGLGLPTRGATSLGVTGRTGLLTLLGFEGGVAQYANGMGVDLIDLQQHVVGNVECSDH